MAIAEGDYTGSTGGKVEDNSLGRLLTLSDDVFAIATTLLALDLRVPELPDPVTNTALLDELGRELPSVLTVLTVREPERRYPILLTLLAESVVDVLDEVVLLFDQALSGRESNARTRLTEELAERARSGEDRQALLDEILAITLDLDIPDKDVGGLVRTRIGMERMRAAWAARRARLPRDHGHLAMLHGSMSYVRQFAPPVLDAVRFAGGPGTEALMGAIGVLCELYATAPAKSHRRPRPSLSRFAGAVTCRPPPTPETSPPTGTTGSCVCCFRCGMGCAREMYSCRGLATTPIPARSCSAPSSSNPAGPVLPAGRQTPRCRHGDRGGHRRAAHRAG
jgi:hypothetical protein